MPRVKRNGPAQTGYKNVHVLQLCIGRDHFGDAFGNDLDAMRAAWPALRERVFALHSKREACKPRDERIPAPWGARFDTED